MRCPDCMKFVGLECGDPEVNMDCSYSEGSFSISGDVRVLRNCADCGTELKALDLCPDVTVTLEQFEGFPALPKEEQEELQNALGQDDSLWHFENDDGEQSEGGGGRFKKNMITTTVPFTIDIYWVREDKPNVNLSYSGQFREEHAASEYEEQV